MITFHFEATEEVGKKTLKYIKRCNVKAGLAFCPKTSASFILKYLNQCDMILLMTRHPGFGEYFYAGSLEKVRFTRDLCNQFRDKAIRNG